MVLTLLNPHSDDFMAGPVSFKLAKRRALKKYGYLITEQVARFGSVDVLIDGTLSSLFPQSVFAAFPKAMRHQILKWEIKQWLTLNGLTDCVRVHWSPETVDDKSCLYLFSYKNCTGVFEKRRETIEAFDRKIINLSHFMIRTAEKGRNAQTLSNVTYTSEADLSETPYFVKHFGAGQRVIVLPFMVAERFDSCRPYEEREDLCGATGSFHRLQYERPRCYYADFMGFFKVDTYHPLRKSLHEQADQLEGYIESKISPYREKGNSLLSRLDISQKTYFSFDVVDFYNRYKYALVGEEIHGLAAIGSFEAMMCGCTLLGQKGSFYKGLGLQPGVHYVEHDGTLEDIQRVMNALRADPETATRIAQNGLVYAQTHCMADQLWTGLTEQLQAF